MPYLVQSEKDRTQTERQTIKYYCTYIAASPHNPHYTFLSIFTTPAFPAQPTPATASSPSNLIISRLLERRLQARIVPGSGLGVMVNEVHTSHIAGPHFPSTGQWAKQWYRLLLSIAIAACRVVCAYLLSSRIDPCISVRIVIHEICSSFWSLALFPSG